MHQAIILGSLLFSSLAFAQENAAAWLAKERPIAVSRLEAAVSRPDAAPGSVIASPSKSNPDYYYHWVRDAGLTMQAIAARYASTGDATSRKLLLEYVDFSRRNQLAKALSGLGEPKFYVDGRAYDLPWGRPQNDGPAIRASALIRLARTLLSKGEGDYVRANLYDSKQPSDSVIKADLEYVAHHWRDASFDLWEEVQGDHFYTRMVQRRALIEGAALADTLGDGGAAGFYRQQARALETEISKHWDASLGWIVPTLSSRKSAVGDKPSRLDSAVILGALHGDAGDGFFTVSSSKVQATLAKLTERFAALYPINQRGDLPGTAIGRYPEDTYSGNDSDKLGNPWVLITLAFAEAHYRLGHVEQGDLFVRRVAAHANPDGSLSEQISRTNGYMSSARDLTWNYAAVLTVDAAARKARGR